MIHKMTGDLDSAIACWEKARRLNPEWASIYFNLGLAWMEKRDFKKAIAFLRTYQEKWGASLPAAEKKRLSSFIQTCLDNLKN